MCNSFRLAHSHCEPNQICSGLSCSMWSPSLHWLTAAGPITQTGPLLLTTVQAEPVYRPGLVYPYFRVWNLIPPHVSAQMGKFYYGRSYSIHRAFEAASGSLSNDVFKAFTRNLQMIEGDMMKAVHLQSKAGRPRSAYTVPSRSQAALHIVFARNI